jgi:hypothetical protein
MWKNAGGSGGAARARWQILMKPFHAGGFAKSVCASFGAAAVAEWSAISEIEWRADSAFLFISSGEMELVIRNLCARPTKFNHHEAATPPVAFLHLAD